MRVQRVGLEHHRHAAVRRLGPTDVKPAYFHRAIRHRLETGNHPQQGRFSTSRWTDEHREFTIRDIQIDTVDHFGFFKGLMDVLQTELRHEFVPVHASTFRCATG